MAKASEKVLEDKDLLGVVISLLVMQKENFCGPASLSSVFKYYSVHVEQEEISKEMYLPKLKEASINNLQKYAEKIGFKTKLLLDYEANKKLWMLSWTKFGAKWEG